ncbi:MAG TPA: efflux RND transporter permease subunit [Patescibacteria group bacterium]|nr:efflux RND transporter permease subunit [Patescibacteria group bacterium]
MSLSSISIKRPVLAIVMSIVIVLFGIIGYTFLGVREFPSVDPAIVTVSTSYTGANAEIIQSQITEPLEESINGIAGIRTLTSSSRNGSSQITVEFNLEVDLETAANDVRDRVARAQRNLPPDADPPTVAKSDADANPIVMITLRSEKRNLLDLTSIANNIFKERIQNIPGVSEVRIWGEKKYSMRLWLDPTRMAAFQLTPLDVRTALNRENVELPSGSIEGNNTELAVRTAGRINTEEEFNNLIITEAGGRIVRFSDIGYAAIAPENERTILKRDGVAMVGLVITPQPGSNQIEIADEFYKRIVDIKRDAPPDIIMEEGFDNTRFIRKSILEVEETIFIAFGLVVLIIFLFLRDWRTTLIPVAAIPISLVGSFFIMYLMDFSINVLTLLAIVLAIGLVVDDAIVVLENIYAKIEEGMPPREAAFRGANEIFFAVISTTIALAAVFLPIMFLQGITGRLFREFGVVIAGSVIISAFVALTLTPMMCAKILKSSKGHNWFYNKTEPFFQRMNNGYRDTLKTFMDVRWMAFVLMAASGFLIYFIGKDLPSELAPLEDRGAIRMNATAVEGATFEYMDRYMDEVVEAIQDSVPESSAIISVTSPGFGGAASTNSGFVRLILKQPEERERSQQEIAANVSKIVAKFSEARANVSQEQSLGARRGGLPIQYIIQASSIDKLREAIPRFLEEARQHPDLQTVDVNLKFSKPEIELTIDRNRARDLGISVQDVAQTLQFALSGQRFGYFIREGKQYQVIGQVARENRNEPLDLRSLYVRNNRGELIQLGSVVTLDEMSSPPQLYRYNRYVSATISAGLTEGKTISDGIAAMDAVAEQTLDETFTTALDGEARDFTESSSSLLFTFMFALILIFLVLAAQFESFRDPFTIMFTVPLALAGALLSLWYFDQTLNVFSQIGIVMLIGLVTKNGILIVEFANQRREDGLSVMEAAEDAAASRFRPILMTSMSTILGTLPIALALGGGAESRVSMGIAVVGGLIFASILTLYIIPAMYTYIAAKELKKHDDDFDRPTVVQKEVQHA